MAISITLWFEFIVKVIIIVVAIDADDWRTVNTRSAASAAHKRTGYACFTAPATASATSLAPAKYIIGLKYY